MNERSTFELRLTAVFEAYADRAPVEVDAVKLAGAIAAERRSSWLPLRWFSSRSLTTRLLLVILLLALVGATAVVGASLLVDSMPAPVPYDKVVTPIGHMSQGRLTPQVVQLADGRVLIAAGFGDAIPAEIFDPTTGTSQALDGPAPTGEQGSTVALPDGKVLMITHNGNYTDSRAWAFDPAAQSFHEITQPGPANAPPWGVEPGVAGLRDGRVLVVGGVDDAMTAHASTLASAMLFDPVSETITPTGSMSVPRAGHSTTALADGRVLVAGGWSVTPERLGLGAYAPGQPTASAEIFDPSAGTFAPTGSMPTVTGPNMAVALPDGRVLVMSSVVEPSDGLAPRPPVAIDTYDPATGRFSPMLPLSIAIDDAVALRDGRVLLAGNQLGELSEPDPQFGAQGSQVALPWAAIFDPSDGSVERVPARAAKDPGITTLRDGTVLFAGGSSWVVPNGTPGVVIPDETWTSVEIFH